MQRIKIPYGGVSPEQLETLAELAEEYSDGIVHITTRQDFQLHFVHIEDTPALMRRLAAAGITTREACGNSVRNVTGCPYAGVCPDEVFDVTPHARALSRFLLGHPDAQDFGHKFKISFSGCATNACALALMHDIGLVAATRRTSGNHPARLRDVRRQRTRLGSLSSEVVLRVRRRGELMPVAQAICASSRGSARSATGRAAPRSDPSSGSTVPPTGRGRRKIIPPDERWSGYLDACTTDDARRARPLPLPRKAALAHLLFHAGVRPTCWRKTARLRDGRGVSPLGDIPRRQLRDWRRSRASTTMATCAPRSSRTSSCAGSPSATWWRFTPTSPRPGLALPGASTSSTSPPARAPTPASSASPRRAVSPASSAPASRRA
jgi:sulfite reductase (ferredoxin)